MEGWEGGEGAWKGGGNARVCGVAVSMAAFQAVDPGSTPGTRTFKPYLQSLRWRIVPALPSSPNIPLS